MRLFTWKIRMLFGLLILSLVVGCGGYGDDDDDDAADDDDDATDDDDDVADDDDDDLAYPAGPYGYTLGSTMASFTLMDSDGNTVKLSDYYGTAKAILINQSAGWCTVCRGEMPLLLDWHDTYKDQGFVILQAIFEKGIVGVKADVEFAKNWKDEYGAPFPVLADPDNIFLSYSPSFQNSNDVPSKPLSLLLDSEMTIVFAQEGLVGESFSGQIENLLSQR